MKLICQELQEIQTVFRPHKRFVNTTCHGWLTTHPDKTMSIGDIPAIAKSALPASATERNIQKGFEVCGILPFNQNLFSDQDIFLSFVITRPVPDARFAEP